VTDKDADLQRDVKVLLMRNYLDPKRFYKVRCPTDGWWRYA
jgi:hypothetical protein